MKKSRVVQGDELGENTLRILREFHDWFFPAPVEEVGSAEFIIFLKWLEDNGYKIVETPEGIH